MADGAGRRPTGHWRRGFQTPAGNFEDSLGFQTTHDLVYQIVKARRIYGIAALQFGLDLEAQETQ